MAKFVHDDVVENILIRLDVKDLIRYKSVCKSWHSLITSTRFINRHLNRSYNKDRCNNELVHRRYNLAGSCDLYSYVCLVGSSNGLVCISSIIGSNLLVANPLTREVRQLTRPSVSGGCIKCWGFGYDSSSDDYKVIVGEGMMMHPICIRVLSLKSNAWTLIGEVKYKFITNVGILCNGALHWIIKDQNNKNLIVSYDFSKNEFKEIPQPDYDARFELRRLGIMDECLCMFSSTLDSRLYNFWLMKNYNVKQSWKLISSYNHNKKYDIVHQLITPKNKSFTFHNDASFYSRALEHQERIWDYTESPIFVQSLVSPHFNGNQGMDRMREFEAVKMTKRRVSRGRRRSKRNKCNISKVSEGRWRSWRAKCHISKPLIMLSICLLLLSTFYYLVFH